MKPDETVLAEHESGRVRLSDAVVTTVLSVVILGPMLVRRGYVLRGDMVFVPDQPWKGAWLGLDGRVPRFVPGDALLSVMGQVLPGDIVQKSLLLGALVIGGLGAGRLTAPWSGVSRAAAITLFLWNPWVYERLAIGQWGVVVGYLLLPWTFLAAEAVRERRPGDWSSWCALAAWLGLSAVFSPASGLVALATAAAAVAIGGRARRAAGVVVLGLVVNLPWILPSVLHADSLVGATGQFQRFAPRSESHLGLFASLLSFGGIWKGSVVPGERASAVVVALSCLLTLVSLLGLLAAARTQPRRVLALALIGGAAVFLAIATSVPAVRSLLDRASTGLPALGLLRDSHRYLGPFVLALVPGLAAAVGWLQSRATRGREVLHVVALLVVLVPLVCLPSLAWGLHGDFQPVQYPREWFTVRDKLPPGRTVVLPWRGGYRGFAWNGRHASLDPSPRFFPGDVLIDDRLFLEGGDLESEDARLRDVRRALDSDHPGERLAGLGVRSVLEEKSAGTPLVELGRRGETLYDGPGLRLTNLGTPVKSATAETWSRSVIVVVDVLVLIGWLAAAVAAGWAGIRRALRQ